jgi:hypothetical protein
MSSFSLSNTLGDREIFYDARTVDITTRVDKYESWDAAFDFYIINFCMIMCETGRFMNATTSAC